MSKLNSKWLIAAALAAALVAGCGGGGDGPGGVGGQAPQPTNPSTSAQGVVDFLLALIANETSELTDPMDTHGITFATEELAEPSSI
jgi:hypothetical protein